jgi:diguanylate cyclase (GGDEF)-like protein
MTYSLIGILAVFIQIIVNYDVFRKQDETRIPAVNAYRRFLISVILFHVADACWGFLSVSGVDAAFFAGSVLIFTMLAISILAWTLFVLRYLEDSNRFDRAFYCIGWVMFAFQIIVLLINFFTPILFYLDDSGTYHPGVARYIVLGIQVMMFLATSVYTLAFNGCSDTRQKRRHLTIGLFGLAMIVATTVQMFDPLIPWYSIGYLLGCCVLHTFVVQDEKAEYLHEVEEAQRQAEKRKKELDATRAKVNTDTLTGVKSKFAYVEAERDMDQRIAASQVEHFAVVVFDLNNLKQINDTQGHEAGNEYITSACRYICDMFAHSPVFRIGGDEFVSILEGRDYENREKIIQEFQAQMEKNMMEGSMVMISHGISEYDPEHDNAYSDVFSRADERMYLYKWLIKERAAKLAESGYFNQ